MPLPSGELPVELDAVEEAASSPGPISARVATNAHLRKGPDITYDQTVTVAAGEMVTVTACSPDCAWYKLDTGDWIVSYLLTDPPGDLPVIVPTFTPTSIPSIAELLPTPTPRVLRTT